jgi:hypothetical protein
LPYVPLDRLFLFHPSGRLAVWSAQLSTRPIWQHSIFNKK